MENLVELKNEELQEIEGGVNWRFLGAPGWLVDTVDFLNGFAEGFDEGFVAGRKTNPF